MGDVLHFSVEDGVGVIAIDSPPVNALSAPVRQALHDGFKAARSDATVRAVVLICGGRTFFAGADISEFGKPPTGPDVAQVLEGMENGDKLVVAAIHGSALGGGLELALHCHYRIAVPSARLGLPEVKLGLLPGLGGTQRLPRLVGVSVALDLITSGRTIGAREGLESGVLDALAEEGRLREDAIAFARRLAQEDAPLRRVRDREDKLLEWRGRPEVFAEFRSKHAQAFRGFKAPENIIRAIEAAVELPYDQGKAREWALFGELVDGVQSAAQRYVFFADREAGKIPDIPRNTAVSPIRRVGVVGAGTMGGGIAMNLLNIGTPVTLLDASREALDRGLATIRRNYEASAKRGRIPASAVDERMALISPTLDYADLGEADLVIEAVFEDVVLKSDVFRRLDAATPRHTILASNTSFLDLDVLAQATARPEQVVGLHFFSPANVMRLLEIVRGRATSNTVLATALDLAKRIGKTAVVSRVGDGFIANRAMRPRGREAERLAMEGIAPAVIDRVLYDYGFAVGQFQMMDIVGLDVIGRGASERTLSSELVARGRLGQKGGGGYYDYDAERDATPSPAAAAAIATVAADLGVKSRPADGEEILARLLYPVVNEGARVLEEGVALRASDIDVALIAGYNWPVFTGGPMFWADTVGLDVIVARLESLRTELGGDFAPCALLTRLAAQGDRFQDL